MTATTNSRNFFRGEIIIIKFVSVVVVIIVIEGVGRLSLATAQPLTQ